MRKKTFSKNTRIIRRLIAGFFLMIILLPIIGFGKTEPSKYELSFEKAAKALFNDPTQFHDPHVIKTLGIIYQPLQKKFGDKQVNYWMEHTLAEMCLLKVGKSWAGAFVHQPHLPQLSTCGFEPSAHFTSELIIGLAHNNIKEYAFKCVHECTSSIDKIKTSYLVDWLKQNIGVDNWSPGMEVQALVAAGVTFNDKWQDASGVDWNLKKILGMTIDRWHSTKKIAKLKAGDQIPENLLHLGPALIEIYIKAPAAFSPYASVLEEVFSFYREIMNPKGYWGFPGEAFSTGHIMEQFYIATNAGFKTAPLSLQPLKLMVERQASDGWFKISDHNIIGAHAHATRAIALGLPFLK